MVRNKFFLVSILTLIFITLALSGCGGGNTETSPTTSSSPAITNQTPASTVPATTPTNNSPTAATNPAAGDSLTAILGKANGIASVKFDATASGAGMPVTTQTIYVKKDKMRMEITANGENLVQFIDMAQRTMYMYMPKQNMAMKMDFSQAPKSNAQEAEEIINSNPVTLGVETLDGKVCTVIEYTAQDARTKSWIWQEYGLPLRMEASTMAGTVVAEYKNYDFSDLDDSLFELPAGVQVNDFGSFGGAGTMPTNFPTNMP